MPYSRVFYFTVLYSTVRNRNGQVLRCANHYCTTITHSGLVVLYNHMRSTTSSVSAYDCTVVEVSSEYIIRAVLCVIYNDQNKLNVLYSTVYCFTVM